MSDQQKLFECFNHLSIKVRALGGIIQNEEAEYSEEELKEWNDIANSVMYSLIQLKENTYQFVSENMR